MPLGTVRGASSQDGSTLCTMSLVLAEWLRLPLQTGARFNAEDVWARTLAARCDS